MSVDYPVPAASGAMAFYVIVDADENGDGTENECLEDNNTASVADVVCPDVN